MKLVFSVLALICIAASSLSQAQNPLVSSQYDGFRQPELGNFPTPNQNTDLVKNILKDRPLIDGSKYVAKSKSGWQSTGGGGAILCFADEKRLEAAKQEASTIGLLSDETINSTVKVFTHERWEQYGEMLDYHLDFATHMIPDDEDPLLAVERLMREFMNMSKQQHLNRIDNLVLTYSPVFFDRLSFVRKMIPQSDWTAAKLTPVPDFQLRPPENLMSPKMTYCLHWPVVVREFKFSGEKLESVQVHYDEAIYNRFSEIDKALIEYHEHVYALANLIGDEKADGVREVVRRIFTLQFWSEVQHSSPSQSLASRNFQRYVGGLLGDYPLFFSDQINEAVKDAPLGTPGSWHRTYYQVVKGGHADLQKCVSEIPSPTIEGIQACNEATYQKMLQGAGEQMPTEAAFILLVRYILDFADVIKGSEWFLTFDMNLGSVRQPIHQEQLDLACEAIASPMLEEHSEIIKNPHLLNRSREYCRTFARLNSQ